MEIKLIYFIYRVLALFDKIIIKFTKNSFLTVFKEFIEEDSYTAINILAKKITFFTPTKITKWRVDTFFSKEPETLEWIDSFKNTNKIIFWDIGSNIGLYSIYAALKHENIEVVSFEPSTSNLRSLSRNISINNLYKKIKISQFPLTEKKNQYLLMKESSFVEGGALHTFGENFDHEGKPFKGKNNYIIYGTSIDYLIDSKILLIPNYIKIDVDSVEHLILRGGKKYLSSPEIKSISVELNENFKEQHDEVFKILQESGFEFINKKRSAKIDVSNKFFGTYNFIFVKKNAFS